MPPASLARSDITNPIAACNLADTRRLQGDGRVRPRLAAVNSHLGAIRSSGFQINLGGDLGAGKTALVRAMLRELGVQDSVKSPTFALLEPYTVSSLDFYHFDFYRLKEPNEFGNGLSGVVRTRPNLRR